MSDIVNGKNAPDIKKRQITKASGRMKTSKAVIAYQKEWFLNLKDQASQGEPVVFSGILSESDILTAMDVPHVNGVWWTSIIATKQATRYYEDIVTRQSAELFGSDYNCLGNCGHCDVGIVQALQYNPEQAPYGGLPKLAAIIAGAGTGNVATTGCIGSLKEVYTQLSHYRRQGYDVPFFWIEPTATSPYFSRYPRFWEKIKEHWDEVIEPYRLDYEVEQLKSLIKFLEVTTGKTCNQDRLMEVLEISNKQQEYWRKARDLIAKTVPCPIGILDHLACYPLQWFRGTPDGQRLSKMFYEEVKERVDKGEAVCPDEKLRFRWVKTGIWTDPALYQYFEDKYGAVFVSSWYPSLAADCYPRNAINNDPLRAIASRSVFLGLYAGPEWDIKEAKLHRCNGAVMLDPPCPMGGFAREMTRQAFDAARMPMLLLPPSWDSEMTKSKFSDFIETRLMSSSI